MNNLESIEFIVIFNKNERTNNVNFIYLSFLKEKDKKKAKIYHYLSSSSSSSSDSVSASLSHLIKTSSLLNAIFFSLSAKL
jgi:hypothetical protein